MTILLISINSLIRLTLEDVSKTFFGFEVKGVDYDAAVVTEITFGE